MELLNQLQNLSFLEQVLLSLALVLAMLLLVRIVINGYEKVKIKISGKEVFELDREDTEEPHTQQEKEKTEAQKESDTQRTGNHT